MAGPHHRRGNVRRRMHTARFGLLLLTFLMIALTACQRAPDKLPTPLAPAVRIGVPFNVGELNQETLSSRLDDAREAFVGTVQFGASWWYLCPQASSCDYRPLDTAVAQATWHGLEVSIQVTGVPDWVHPDLAHLPEQVRHWTPPRTVAERASFTDFVAELANRYRGRVRRYEIWNEPNLPGFNQPHPDPAVAARTIAAGYLGAKRGDPNAVVVTGGLSRADIGFARALLTELAGLPGAAQANGYVDEVGVHPYADELSPLAWLPQKVWPGQYGPWDHNFGGFEEILRLLDRLGRPATKVWLGEFGYSTTRTWMAPVPDARRALFLMLAADRVRHHPRVSGLIWYGFLPHSATPPAWAIVPAQGGTSLTFQALRAANRGPTALSPPRPAPAGCPPTGGPAQAGETALQTPADIGAGQTPEPVTGSRTLTWPAICFGVNEAIDAYEVYLDGLLSTTGRGPVARLDAAALRGGEHWVTVAFYPPGKPPHYTPDMLSAVRNTNGDSRVEK